MESSLKEAMQIDGALGVALVDYTSGMALGTIGTSKDFDLSIAAAGNTDVVRAKLRTLEMLKLKESIEDILITLANQYHIIRPLTSRNTQGLFLYLVLSKNRIGRASCRERVEITAGAG